MNQIKYILMAGLILVFIIFGFVLISPSTTDRALESSNFNSIEKSMREVRANHFNPKGKQLYKIHCSTCHKLDAICAYPMNDISSRGPWNDRKNLLSFIKNPAAFIPTTEYTRKLRATWGTTMPSFEHLDQDELDLIIDFMLTQ